MTTLMNVSPQSISLPIRKVVIDDVTRGLLKLDNEDGISKIITIYSAILGNPEYILLTIMFKPTFTLTETVKQAMNSICDLVEDYNK